MKKKRISLVMALLLVLTCVIGGTIAWLTDSTDAVVNTFTVGDINIILEETDTEIDGDANLNTNAYKMIPGNTITKDPTVTVEAGSEDCWLFVKVEKSSNFVDFMTYAISDGWTALEVEGVQVEGVYYRTASAGDSFNVLNDDQVIVKNTVTKEMMKEAETNKPTLTFTAYAVQKANIDTAAAAWAEVSQ